MGSTLKNDRLGLEDQNGENKKWIQNISGVLKIFGIKVGTATIPANASTVTVTHGLGTTPTFVIPFPSQNLGNLTYASLGATTFVINSSATTGTDTTILWLAVTLAA